ncbi:FAD-linked sulfhydryl oxidase ERV2 [Uncinocarpus reesii 1704]|uniref:Sulfhydryl oxidase n=1 Tax=Uncinocarpus reesii (strain UAMH 1704) TaxID=336963 RepID=C4JPF7_UNCRE|nr:FAD-linked sulfhydryl oxidase ERV2 [Uncinocarpus reesii 1704]EEP79693.1 FAD-linked sulfhydryl oxidase ERV2 [Uncinocarpus reesii 1704]
MATRPTSRLFAITGIVVFFILTLTYFRQQAPLSPEARAPGHFGKPLPGAGGISDKMLQGNIVMPKLGNATAKAELGRASWRLLHTMMARFPEKPSKEEQDALRSYIFLFARLYPWEGRADTGASFLISGECAEHFQQHLKKFPPQVSTRNAAAGWACHIHNEVNKMLKKEIFDCTKLGDFYDCGCSDKHGDAEKPKEINGKGEIPAARLNQLTNLGREFDSSVLTPVEIHPEP